MIERSNSLNTPTQHLEHHPSGRRKGVQALDVQVEVHALGLQLPQEGKSCRLLRPLLRRWVGADFGA